MTLMVVWIVTLLVHPPPAQPAAEARAIAAKADAHFAKNEDAEALAAYEQAIRLDPSQPEYHVGKGRTLARLRRYDEAFLAYGEALRLRPGDPMILRYRGHNYINVRKFDLALADLEAAEAKKSDDFGIYYHLALAYYLTGQFAKAAHAYEGCVRTAAGDEERVSCWAWQYPALRRAGRREDAEALLARVTPDLKVSENNAYLDRLLLFKGVKTEEQVAAQMGASALARATVGYGIGLWHLIEGRPDRARVYFEQATTSDAWQAFGYIAAEIELARMKGGEPNAARAARARARQAG
jgi:tetratricopeptide (TPR) repeat protein